MNTRIANLLRSHLLQDVVALYGVQIARKMIPLVAVPVLARALGPSGWGVVAFVLSFSTFLILLVEFGFDLSATRAIARVRESTEECARIVAGVVGSQLLLYLAGVTVAVPIAYAIPMLRSDPLLVAVGLMAALPQALSPLWFFQGMERVRIVAGLDIAGKLLSLAGMLLLVDGPEDAWKVLALYGVAPALFTTAGFCLMFQTVPLRMPSWESMRESLAGSWPMFLLKASKSLYGVANVFLLGLFAPPFIVGYFAAAEKISTAVYGLLNPIEQALFPRLSHMVHQAPEKALRLVRIGLALMLSGGTMLMLALMAGAPYLIRLLMGSRFQEAVPVLRILALFLPFAGVTIALGFQWLLPLGLERYMNRIILTGGVINIALGSLLSSRFGHLGMAWAVVSTELFVCAASLLTVAAVAPLWPAGARATHPALLLKRAADPIAER